MVISMRNDEITRERCTARRHDTALAARHHGCRCPAAREAERLYRKRLREGRQAPGLVSAIGTHRRIRALMAIGWPSDEIARRLGWAGSKVLFRSLRTTYVQRKTYNAVAALYDELSLIPGPSAITRGRARGAGHHPPLAWDDIDRDPEPPKTECSADDDEVDPVAVFRVVTGDRPKTLRQADLHAAIIELARRREPASRIAERAGCSVKTVQLHRAGKRSGRSGGRPSRTRRLESLTDQNLSA